MVAQTCLKISAVTFLKQKDYNAVVWMGYKWDLVIEGMR